MIHFLAPLFKIDFYYLPLIKLLFAGNGKLFDLLTITEIHIKISFQYAHFT